ncbi:CbaC protein [Halobellus sp. GM3]|uniref:CbaC protein n=1 Tax=Halobellus sp. GM3 TaxID=3458410 RepID=UPI00403E1645
MRRLSPAILLLLAAFSVPVAVELRTVLGFFGVDLPFVAVVVIELLLLAALFAVYVIGRLSPDDDRGTAAP